MTDETSRHRRTYSQLKDFTDGLQQSNVRSSPLSEVVHSFLMPTTPASAATKTWVGFRFLGLNLEAGLLEFRSNRFFLDALSLPLMPEESELLSTRSQIESAARKLELPASIEQLLDSFVQDQLGALMATDLPSIFRGHRMPVLTETDWMFLEDHGYLVVKNALPLDLCDHLGDRLNALARFEAGSQRGGYFYGSGRMQRVYQLLGKDELFRDLLLHPICDQVMSHMFFRATYHDKYYLTSFHGNLLQPGAEPQIWHVDANVPDPLPSWIIRSNSNYVIQDYTEENGATEIIPGSHKLLRKPNKAEAEGHGLKTIQMCAPKGSLVFWHGHLWHRSGANRSSGNRAALLAAYAASFFREVCMEENPYLYFNTNTSVRFSPQLKRLLGWEHGVKDYA